VTRPSLTILIEWQDDLMLKPVVDHRQHVACVHGTTKEAWALIEKTGLNRMARKHIHFRSVRH